MAADVESVSNDFQGGLNGQAATSAFRNPRLLVVLSAIAFGLFLGYTFVFAASLERFSGLTATLFDSCSTTFWIAQVAVLVIYAIQGVYRNYGINKITIVAVGLVLSFATMMFGPLSDTFGVVILTACVGGATGFFLLVWSLYISSLQKTHVVCLTLASALLATLLYLVLQYVQKDLLLALLSMTALTTPVFVLVADPDLTSLGPETETLKQPGPFPYLPCLLFMIVCFSSSALFGSVADIVGSFALYHGPFDRVLSVALTVSCVLVGAGMILARKEWPSLVWLPLFVLFLLAVAAVGMSRVSLQGFAFPALLALFVACQTLRWTVICSYVSMFKTSRMLYCAVMLIATSWSLGNATGSAVSSLFSSTIGDSAVAACLVALTVFAVVLLVYSLRGSTVVAPAEHVDEAAQTDGEAVPTDRDVRQTPSFKEIYETFASERGLTSREIEIGLLTARGYTSTRIAEMLIISASTVRFHQQNIYKKLEVHTRQDYIDLVSSEVSSLS